MNTNKILPILIAAIVLITSCNSMYWSKYEDAIPEDLTIEVMKPAQIDIPDTVKTLVVADFSLRKNQKAATLNNNKKRNVSFSTDSVISALYVNIIADTINKTERFNTIVPTGIRLKNTASTTDWDALQKICDANNADAILALDALEMSFPVAMFKNNYYAHSGRSRHHEGGYTARLNVEIKQNWKIYYPATKKVIDSYVFTYKRSFEESGKNKKQAVKLLPGKTKIAKIAGDYFLEKYMHRVAPYWKTTERYYYTPENEEMQKATEKAEAGNWEEAAETWENQTQNENREIARQASYNLALAYEMEGELEKAYQQAHKTWKTYKYEEAHHYAYLLSKRLKDLEHLKIQLGE